MVPKAFCKSMRIIPISRPESKPVHILSVRYEREISDEWFYQKPDQNYRKSCFPSDNS